MKGRGRKPPKPKVLQARKLTVKSATAQYVETTRAIEGLAMLQKDARAFLIETAEKTGKRVFGDDDIAVVQTGGGLVLDQPKAKDRLLEIGDRLEDYMKRQKFGLALQLLK
ncbi:MAG: hypothetical protein ACYDA6_09670 [Solirubrobacteraceae bacterium]